MYNKSEIGDVDPLPVREFSPWVMATYEIPCQILLPVAHLNGDSFRFASHH